MSTKSTISKIDYPVAPPKTKTRWLMHVPVISTGHVSREDSDALLDGGGSLVMAQLDGGEGGVILCLDDLEDVEENYSLQLFQLLSAFQDLGYDYLRLDPDGDRVKGLRWFDW